MRIAKEYKMKFIPFEPKQPLPEEREDVIVRLEPTGTIPAAYVWGYLRYDNGNKNCPYFVTPGVEKSHIRKITHWCKCLPKGFHEEVLKLEKEKAIKGKIKLKRKNKDE
jgi:hypothetical protein